MKPISKYIGTRLEDKGLRFKLFNKVKKTFKFWAYHPVRHNIGGKINILTSDGIQRNIIDKLDETN